VGYPVNCQSSKLIILANSVRIILMESRYSKARLRLRVNVYLKSSLEASFDSTQEVAFISFVFGLKKGWRLHFSLPNWLTKSSISLSTSEFAQECELRCDKMSLPVRTLTRIIVYLL
jgi:hypothetical protein